MKNLGPIVKLGSLREVFTVAGNNLVSFKLLFQWVTPRGSKLLYFELFRWPEQRSSDQLRFEELAVLW